MLLRCLLGLLVQLQLHRAGRSRGRLANVSVRRDGDRAREWVGQPAISGRREIVGHELQTIPHVVRIGRQRALVGGQRLRLSHGLTVSVGLRQRGRVRARRDGGRLLRTIGTGDRSRLRGVEECAGELRLGLDGGRLQCGGVGHRLRNRGLVGSGRNGHRGG